MGQLVRPVSGDNLLFYVFSTPWSRSQQEAEWVHVNFERRDLNSPHKSHPLPDDFGEICICITFLHIVSTVAYLTMVAHQCPLSLPRPVLDIEPHQTAIFKKVCNSGICWYENGHTGIPGLWTQVLNAGLWTMDPGRWTRMLHFGRWALGTGHSLTVLEQKQKPVSDSAWLNYLGCESLGTSWSRLFCRDYSFWRGYF